MIKKNTYVTWIMVTLLYGFSYANAAPSVSNAITDGNRITISGSSFGENSLNFEWTGDAIEGGTAGQAFSRTGWTNGQDYSDSVYATDQAHSGSKSLKAGPYKESSGYGGDLRYRQSVGPNTDLFMSWWVRRTVTGTGQWKMLRISETNSIVDHAYEQVWFNWNNGYGYQIFTRATAVDCTQGGGNCDYGAKFPTSNNVWYRIDFYMHTSSAGTADGNYTQILYTPGSALQSNTETSVLNWGSGHTYNYLIFQNWAGNGVSSQTHWMDDIYISGTQARVEICDTSVWANRTHCEIQTPSAWAADEITAKLNEGSFDFDTDTLYLFVVDAKGNPSAGHKITFGGSGGGGDDTTNQPPGAPKSVDIIE